MDTILVEEYDTIYFIDFDGLETDVLGSKIQLADPIHGACTSIY